VTTLAKLVADAGRTVLEDTLARQLDAVRIAYRREVRLCPPRRHRWDFVIGDICVDVQGGQWVQGRHNRPSGYAADCEKTYLAVSAGYRVLAVTGEQVQSGVALQWIEELVRQGGKR